jgi:hypothetical protein
MTHAVDEEGRRAVDAASHAAHKIFANALSIPSFGKLTRKPDSIEFELLSKSDEMPIIKRLLILEEKVMHLPEAALRSGGLRGFCRAFCVGMYLREREMTVSETKAVAQHLLNLFDYFVRLAAMRALEVAVLNYGHGGQW